MTHQQTQQPDVLQPSIITDHQQHCSSASAAAAAAAAESQQQQQAAPAGPDAAVTIAADPVPSDQNNNSIYDLTSSRRRYAILVAVAIGSVLAPFSETVYLPALQAVGQELHADEGLVAASVAIYFFMTGLGCLIWGPLSDRIGRRLSYLICSVTFLGTTLGCAFAPTIAVLVTFRALQGLAVAAYVTTGQGVIADIFPPKTRGTAMGLFLIPLLVGPVLGPVFGGALSQAFGWRSTFICLAVFCGAVVVPLLAVLVPETHQFKVLRSLQKQQPGVTLKIMEAETILNAKPVLQGPWVAVGYLLESGILPYALVTMMIFGILIASLTEWPAQMSTAPYSMNEAIMGISYLANGLGGLFSSPVGGKVSDFTAARHPGILEARLLGNTAIAAFIMPVGCLLYGWSLQEKTHLVAPLVGHFLIGAASAGWMPGFYGYVSSVKQANAGAASAAGQFVMFVTAGSLVLVSVSAVHKMGIGPYFTLLAGLQFLLAAVAACCIWKQFRLQNRQRQHEAAGPKPARNLHTS